MENVKAQLVGSTVEEARLKECREETKNWYRWGPYLSDRSWATVREDYSDDGDAWSFFPFEHANSRVFRWNEDGIFGVSDENQEVCINLALWNGKDSILKERFFGLTGSQGNHGEDVKELYYYLDNLPTHSYMKSLYKYPFMKEFPYNLIIDANKNLNLNDREFEIYNLKDYFQNEIDRDNNYFDIFFEMGKDDLDPEILNFKITAFNRSEKNIGELYVIPQIFYRNTWSWNGENAKKPVLRKNSVFTNVIDIDHENFKDKCIIFQPSPGNTIDTVKPVENEIDTDVLPQLLFTDNESNLKKLFKEVENHSPFTKDAFQEFLINGEKNVTNPNDLGTKACAIYYFKNIPPNECVTVRYKLTNKNDNEIFNLENLAVINEDVLDLNLLKKFDEANNFYWRITPLQLNNELRLIQRQAFAGLLWSKQFYNFTFDEWYNGDTKILPRPLKDRANSRNKNWKHLFIKNILSMPDKWEYPFFASWDTAFHCIPFAMIDPDFAKIQLDLLTREWFMHPNGQIPAYEWNFNDVNPPVHAWAVYRTFKIERNLYNREDRVFLERTFQKLLINFTWWVNRKDKDGKNIFEGGFLGLDNIGIFNRSEPLPTGGKLKQADSTGWMAFFSLQMLNISLELAKKNPVYEDIASKFFEHFVLISDSMSFEYINDITNNSERQIIRQNLWNENDHFYYDSINWTDDNKQQLPIKSLVGLIPLYASMTLEPNLLNQFPNFKKRIDWFINNRPEIFDRNIASMSKLGVGKRLLLSLTTKERLKSILNRMLDETEFLSKFGIRSLSKFHEKNPFSMIVNNENFNVNYIPGESNSKMFGGNSNWRGPIWFPTNFLLIEALQRFFLYYGPEFVVECPVGSNKFLNLAEISQELSLRLIKLFMIDEQKNVRVSNDQSNSNDLFSDPHFRNLINFYEYFDGDTGRGLGASHQCGWTALVAKLISDVGLSNVKQNTKLFESLDLQYKDSTIKKTNLRPILQKCVTNKKSARSLMKYTGTLLELTEEEKLQHALNGTESNGHSAKSQQDPHDLESGLIMNLKNQISNISLALSKEDQELMLIEKHSEFTCQ